MADILIKNMEMPKTGNLVVCISSDGTVTVPYDYTLHFETPVPQTKAIELPPHGRLVNLDDVYEAINREIVPKGIFLSDFYKAFADIPTVLEAST